MVPKYIKPPEINRELKKHMDMYTAAGLPGCFCSTDGINLFLSIFISFLIKN